MSYKYKIHKQELIKHNLRTWNLGFEKNVIHLVSVEIMYKNTSTKVYHAKWPKWTSEVLQGYAVAPYLLD